MTVRFKAVNSCWKLFQAHAVRDGDADPGDGELVGNHDLRVGVAPVQSSHTGALRNVRPALRQALVADRALSSR